MMTLEEIAAAEARAKSATEFAWVIEHCDSPPSAPRYFTGSRNPALRWSDPGAHEDACRFARKKDAERIARLAGFYEPNPVHRICEHVWTTENTQDTDVPRLAATARTVIELLHNMPHYGDVRYRDWNVRVLAFIATVTQKGGG